MKRTNQVLVLAAALVVSSGAMANSANTSSGGSFASSAAILNAVDSASRHVISFSNGTEQKLELTRDALRREATPMMAQSSVLSKGFGSSLAVGALSVQSIQIAVEASRTVFTVVTEGVMTGSRYVLTIAEKHVPAMANQSSGAVATSSQGIVSAVTEVIKVGSNIVVATTSSGKVLIEDAGKASSAGVHGQSAKSSQLLFGSFGHAVDAFKAELVKGYK